MAAQLRLQVVGAAVAGFVDAEHEPVHQAGEDSSQDRTHPVYLTDISQFNELKPPSCYIKPLLFSLIILAQYIVIY